MKKILLSIGALLVLAIAALLAAAATRPDTFRVERSVTIAATTDKIHPLLNDMQRFNTWNPFNKKDPAMKASYRGPVAGPGAAYDFAGDHNIGKGSIEIVPPRGPDTVSMRLHMIEPMEAFNEIDFRLQPEGGNTTRVTWSMQAPVPFVAKVMHVIFDVEKMVATDFDAGLASLKALAERG
jgi:hypothetical protein